MQNPNRYRHRSDPVGRKLALFLFLVVTSLVTIDTITMPVVVESVATGEIVECYRYTLWGERVPLSVQEATRGRYDRMLAE